ncbi:NAD(P)/FAD-dependent oxidoreductase [Gordonia sp. PDNC005]|uniref:NAD(P)/FAD-dependent oxidoreductase n=1 Tax=unclassified Gordonia (in: high G+C Gram-positive bacteria) TaxID=2657482 RepID=UPI0019668312|nr:NAD(P)/FAD-dependent oxidoreductase [Gordonia sp. PDNC005]QRY61512.1 NAD(P)/FAD-dependent oxidoreductase [Gordonia sp. PDNC005]
MRTTDVVVIGSGFGGLAAAKRLAKSKIETVLISATDEHLFQPLLYQVATGVLESEEIAPSIADVLASRQSVSVVRGHVTDVDAENKVITYRTDTGVEQIRYRSLVAAAGVAQGYFGHDEWADRTFSLKTLDDAVSLRAHLLECFAQPVGDVDAHTYVVVGAGATGVEIAGQIRELSTRHFTDVPAKVYLVEGADDVLPVYGGKLSTFARRTLEKSGVEVLTGTVVTDISDGRVTLRNGDDERVLESRTVVWSAGVQATGLAKVIAEATGCATDRAGRLLVNNDLTVGDRADVFAIGDMTSLKGYPGQSPVAMQQGRFVADVIRGKKPAGAEFVYLDKGSMAVVNRHNAVVDAPFGVTLTGALGWITWLGVHLYYLVGFRNQAAAVASWFKSFVGRARPGFEQVVPVASTEVDDRSAA